MLRINRTRFMGILCVTVFIYFLIFTDTGSSTSNEFRSSTEAGLARIRTKQNQLPLRGDLSDEDLTKKTYEELQGILESQSKEGVKKDADGNTMGRVERESVLKGLEEEPKKKNSDDQKAKSAPTVKASIDEEDPVAASRKEMQKPKYLVSDDAEKVLGSMKSAIDSADTDDDGGMDSGKDFAREKLMEYLKYPVVIFSKSYCPHSKRTKQLLLEIYNINPKPLVVELDMLGEKIPSSDPSEESHVTLGKALQDLLGEVSGRRTVPNIMIGGSHSIGGNDKVWELHESGLLAVEIKKLGGRKLISVDVHDSEDDGQR